MGVYGPYPQVKRLFKTLVFLKCKNNIIIYSQMRFHLHQSHRLTDIGLQSGKRSKNCVSLGNFRDFKVALKLKLQT